MTELSGRFMDVGSADQVAVLFLHAFPYQRAMWAPQVDALAGQARVLALDVRGHTPGSAAPTAYMLEHLVDDTLALLDARGVERCVLCGLSMGGYVALRLTQRAPQRVRALLLSNTQAASDSNQAKEARAEGLRTLWSRGLTAFAEAQLARQLAPTTAARSPALVERLRAQILALTPEAVTASMVAIATRPDLSAFVREIAVPTAVAVGAHDAITPPAVATELARAIPGASLHVLEGAGHLSNVEAAPEFNAVLGDLIAKVR